MSAVFYQFVSNTQTGWCQSRTCNLCKKKVERQGAPPRNEQEGGSTQRFPDGAFHGWAGISFRLEPRDGTEPRDVYLDVCDTCRQVLFDSWSDAGLDWTRGETQVVHLDASGQPCNPIELQGHPMCVWRAESKAGIRPCRRFMGHEGECSVTGDGAVQCPLCPEPYLWDETRPPTIYSTRALEHHAQVEHLFMHTELGWSRMFGRYYNEFFGPHPTAYEALVAAARRPG